MGGHRRLFPQLSTGTPQRTIRAEEWNQPSIETLAATDISAYPWLSFVSGADLKSGGGMGRTWAAGLMSIGTIIGLMPSLGAAQVQKSKGRQVAPQPPRRTDMAILSGLLTNIVTNRIDAWVFGLDWAKVGPSTWRSNFR